MTPYRLTWLADVARSVGLTVIEEPGWRSRGAPFLAPIAGVIGHHTAVKSSRPCPSTRLLIEGRPDLDGPLAQYQLCRDAEVHVIASGIANHAGTGTWPGIPRLPKSLGGANGNTVGIEAENDGVGEVWPVAQMEAYAVLSAAVLDHLELDESRWCAHYEWRRPIGFKLDPRGKWAGIGDWYDGKPWHAGARLATANAFRARVAEHLEDNWMGFTPDEKALLLKGAQAALDSEARWDETARLKLDEMYVDMEGFDHPEVLAGKVQAILDKVGAEPPRGDLDEPELPDD